MSKCNPPPNPIFQNIRLLTFSSRPFHLPLLLHLTKMHMDTNSKNKTIIIHLRWWPFHYLTLARFCIVSNIMNEFQWTNETPLYKKYISHFILERGPTVCRLSRDRWRDIYSERGLLLVPYLLLWAKGCQRLHPLASRVVREVRNTSDRLRVPRSTLILCTLSKSDRVVLITWSPSGYTPVVPDCPDVLSYPCLLITAWQLVKAHRVTRNEPKIHVICYITRSRYYLIYFFIISSRGWVFPYEYIKNTIQIYISFPKKTIAPSSAIP